MAHTILQHNQRQIMKNILTSLLALLFVTSVNAMEDDCFRLGAYKYYILLDSTVAIADAGADVMLPVSEDSTLVLPSDVTYEGSDI